MSDNSPTGAFLEPFGRPLLRGLGLPGDAPSAAPPAPKCISAPASLGLPGSSTGLLEVLLLEPFGRPLLRPSGLWVGESPMICTEGLVADASPAA